MRGESSEGGGRRLCRLAFTMVLALLLGALATGESRAGVGVTTRVSVDSSGNQGNGDSYGISLSADGRYVAFDSIADNLVVGDSNGTSDVFVHDRQTGQTTRVSVDSSGNQGDGDSNDPSISADGRYVAFSSGATNLVPGDNNSLDDIFVHDRLTGQTTRVSVASDGTEGDFAGSYNPSISADGRYVAFSSYATNLVPGGTNYYPDIFVHDRQTGQTTQVSVDSSGNQADYYSYYPSISADGRYVAFQSDATNLVPTDVNGNAPDIFVHDRQTGQTTLVSVDSAGIQGNDMSMRPRISADGRYVAFQSVATNLVPGDTNGPFFDAFVHDRQTGQTTLVSVDSAGGQANGESSVDSISADGRYVAFSSVATNLVLGDANGGYDVFVHDRQTGQTTRASVDTSGTQGNSDSFSASISGDGRYVAFGSNATNLVPGDTNGFTDVFVRRMPATNVAPNDFDGDGKTDIGVWRQDTGYWYIVRSSDNAVISEQWGLASVSDVPVPGDYDGDGQTDFAVWRASTGYWYVKRSSDNVVVSEQWGLGSVGDVPVPGDYDGDGKTDFAVWRKDTGYWYIKRSSDGGVTTRQWGLASVSDVPIPGR